MMMMMTVYMYIYIYIYIYIYSIHTCMLTYTHAYTYTYIHTKSTCIHVYSTWMHVICRDTFVCRFACIHTAYQYIRTYNRDLRWSSGNTFDYGVPKVDGSIL